MQFLKNRFHFFLFCLFYFSFGNEFVFATDKFQFPFYAGLTAGYGSTTWDGLVPAKQKQNPATMVSTPIRVHEGGFVDGFFVGYEFCPCFALELSYMHFPKANIIFSPLSYFAFTHDRRISFKSATELWTLMTKIMMFVPHTTVRAFSSVGLAALHRNDVVKNRRRVNPTFGFGFNYNFTQHVMGEIGLNYTGGYGESQLDPVKNYVPFLYSGFLRLAYRF